MNRKENFHIVKTKECISYLKKVTTDVHNVFNNTLEQKHLFIFNNEYVFHKRQDTDCNFQDVQCLIFDSNFEVKNNEYEIDVLLVTNHDPYCLLVSPDEIFYLFARERLRQR